MTSPIDTAHVEIVPDFSDFGRKVSAGVDAALRGVVGDVRSAFGTVERAAAEAGAEVGREFQQGGESAERALREISSTAKREFREVDTAAAAAGAGLRTKLGGALGFVKTALIGVTVATGAGLAALTGFGLKSAAELEQVQVAFNSLLGSAEKGTEVFKGLQAFAACVDTTTQAFTEDGWASYADLQVGQNILTVNPATGLAEWQPIQAMHIYDGDHQVLRLGGQHHASVSTLNHRWPIHARSQHRHRILFATSETLDEGDQLIGAAALGAPPVEAVHSDEFVELVAWFWTEGSIHPPSQDLDAPHARATIRQSLRTNPDKCARIAAALEKEFGPAGGGNWGVTGPDADGGMQWRLARERAKLLVAAAPDRVPTMTFLRSLTPQQLELFIAVSLLGDGHIRPQTGQMVLTQKRYDQAERFADAVSLSGRRCRLFQADDGRRWVVSVYRTSPMIGLSHARRSDVQWKRETYRGVVWCPQVANGTWFAQHAGHRFFTGNSTPFEFPEVAGAAQRFLAFNDAVGLSDDALQPFLTTLGDVASVTGGGAQALNSVTLAMGQIASSGKLTLDNLNQISEALPGFSGVAAIASATGKTTAQVMEEISAGEINATTGIQALLAGMAKFPGAAGAMEKQSQTLLGVFSTFKDTLSQALVGGFTPVIPEIKASLGQLTPILGDALGQLAPSLGKLLSGLLPLIGSLVQGIVPILSPILDALGPALQALGPTLVPLGEALGEIVVALAPVLPLLGEFLAVLVQVAIPVLQLLALVLKPLTPVLQFMADAVGELGKALGMIDWGAVGNAVGGGFADAWNAVGDFFVGIGEWFSNLPGMIGDALQALPGILLDGTKRAFDLFFTAVGFGIGLILKFFINLPSQIGALVSQLWSTVVALTWAGIQTTIQFFKDLPGTVSALVSQLWAKVKEIFTTGVSNAITLVKSLPGRILDALSGLKDKLFATGKNMILGLIDGIKATIGRAIDAVKRAMADIVNGAKKALGIASPSAVFADAVGSQIPAGIEEGIQAGVPSLQRLLGQITAPTTVNNTSAAGGGVVFGAGSVVVQFAGATPSTADARRVGQTVGASIAATLQRRNIATAVRSL